MDAVFRVSRGSRQNLADVVGRRSARIMREVHKGSVMLDFLMIAYGVGFFVIAILYSLACEKM